MITVLMPCLNEVETLETCITKAKSWANSKSFPVEILIADNGSTDGSIEIATKHLVKIVKVNNKGYGAALDAGIKSASYEFVVMADADDSYDFTKLDPFFEALSSGADFVIGNRFAGGIEKGAMPWKNRYIGNPILSFLGRLLFKVRIKDFHCGIRGLRRSSYLQLGMKTRGMEFATEMVVRFAQKGFRVAEVSTTLSKDGRSRPPHLRPYRDGWRHLKFMLLLSPKITFMIPGLVGTFLFLILFVSLSFGPIQIGVLNLSRLSFLYSLAGIVICIQLFLLGVVFELQYEPEKLVSKPKSVFLKKFFSGELVLERGILTSFVFIFSGFVLSTSAFKTWADSNFSELPGSLLTLVGWSILLILSGIEFFFTALVANYLSELKNNPKLKTIN